MYTPEKGWIHHQRSFVDKIQCLLHPQQLQTHRDYPAIPNQRIWSTMRIRDQQEKCFFFFSWELRNEWSENKNCQMQIILQHYCSKTKSDIITTTAKPLGSILFTFEPIFLTICIWLILNTEILLRNLKK